MLEALLTAHNRALTFVFLAACCASAIGAGAVGVSDNPPGILLAFVAAATLLLAFVHPWRTARQFKYLFYASVLGLVFFGIVHNVFDAVAGESANASALHSLLEGLGDAAFFLAVFGCPPAFLISAAGWLVMSDPKPMGDSIRPGEVYYSEGWWRSDGSKRYGPYATREEAEKSPSA